MTKYLKKILFSLLIIAIPYMNSASNAMDKEDHDGSTVRASKVSFFEEDKQDCLSFSKPSNLSKTSNLEDSKVSWTSYLSSPVKKIGQNIENIINFAVEHPRAATVVGLLYLTNAAAAVEAMIEATCQCVCKSSSSPSFPFGCSVNAAQCAGQCSAHNYIFVSCNTPCQ